MEVITERDSSSLTDSINFLLLSCIPPDHLLNLALPTFTLACLYIAPCYFVTFPWRYLLSIICPPRPCIALISTTSMFTLFSKNISMYFFLERSPSVVLKPTKSCPKWMWAYSTSQDMRTFEKTLEDLRVRKSRETNVVMEFKNVYICDRKIQQAVELCERRIGEWKETKIRSTSQKPVPLVCDFSSPMFTFKVQTNATQHSPTGQK